ncbi:Tumor protein p63-regulated protein 1-like protein [Mactra antiquata]
MEEMTETSAKMSINSTDQHLDDDKHPKEDTFGGATLEISNDNTNAEPEVEFSGPGLNRNRPGSTIGRQSVRSTSSRTSMKPGGYKSAKSSDSFFCYKESAFESAVTDCNKEYYKNDLDGETVGSWLLTEIDHWDNEREKVIVLTENSILVYRYNFINKKLTDFRRISLHVIDTMMIGDFKYPEWSVMPMVSSDREHGGIKIMFNKGEEPSFGQRWNPWCSTIPWITFAHHPLIYNPKENETVTFNVDDFYESLIQAVSKAYNRRRPGEKVTVIEGPIEIQSYASLSSMVFNQSGIGYYKDRNGMCF